MCSTIIQLANALTGALTSQDITAPGSMQQLRATTISAVDGQTGANAVQLPAAAHRPADRGSRRQLVVAVETWWPQILAFIRTGITNAGSEGTNRVIKTVGRDAYGFRNPENQRLRTRCGHHPAPPRPPQPRLTSKSHNA